MARLEESIPANGEGSRRSHARRCGRHNALNLPGFPKQEGKSQGFHSPPEAHPEIVMDAGLMLWKNSKLTNQNPGHFAALIWTGTGSVTTQAPSMLPRNWDSSCIG